MSSTACFFLLFSREVYPLVHLHYSRLPSANTVVNSSWDKFIAEEQVGDIIETITKSFVSRTKYYFINYKKILLLSHCPIDQFNVVMLRPSRGILDLPARQCRFHKKLSQLATNTSVYLVLLTMEATIMV